MKGKIELLIGFVMGIVCPIFGMVMFFEIKPEYAMYDNFDPEAFKELIFKISFIGVLLDMGLFALALQFNKDSVARGVLWATFLFLAGAIVYRFIL